eukprot:scaffold839_cov138-Cylindrotheca_fusiformis.AAC.2
MEIEVHFLATTVFLVSLVFLIASDAITAFPSVVAPQRNWLNCERAARCKYRRYMIRNNDDVSSGFRLGYVTDVEGNLDYFLKFVSKCQVVNANLVHKNGNIQEFKLSLADENCYFVYGGDAIDKGPGDIRLVRALVDFKRTYPSRVFLLVGNRDLNKLRFTAELSRDDMARSVEEIPGPHWDPSAPTLKEYLETIMDKDASSSIDSLNTHPNRLRYMLEHTLGCPKTFEYRRTELAILHNKPIKDISDEEVVNNFLYEVEDGSLSEYFDCANVAVVIGNTLFCHGAVDKDTMQFVPRIDTKFENPPSKPSPAKLAETVQEWVDSLNGFLKDGLRDYKDRPLWNADRTSRGGESLMALQNRPAMWGRSIISNCYGDGGCITTKSAAEHRLDPRRLEQESTNPLIFEKVCSDPKDPAVAAWLLKYGIQRVVVGHKPTGDAPAVLSSQYTGVEIVSADTSFSDTKAKDNRGVATSVVEIIGASSHDNQLHLRGTLRNGKSYHSTFQRLHSKTQKDTSQGDPYLGRQAKDGDWWIKVKTNDHMYCFTRGSGRHVECMFVPESEVATWQLT